MLLTEQDLIKLAMEPAIPITPQIQTTSEPTDPRTPTRKVYDAMVNGVAMAGGGVSSAIAGLNSLDKSAPVRHIG